MGYVLTMSKISICVPVYTMKDKTAEKFLVEFFSHLMFQSFKDFNEDRTQFFNTKLPWYGNKYVNGDNTTGNPSNYAVRKDCALEMDDSLLWIVDGEYFYRSYFYHGDPIMINEVLVCFREHTSSAFRDPKFMELDTKERQYCADKYNAGMPPKEVALSWK